jgi:hypothetical protein
MLGCSSAGEHYLDTVGVVGSIPISPTIIPTFIFFWILSASAALLFSWGSHHFIVDPPPRSASGKLIEVSADNFRSSYIRRPASGLGTVVIE